MLITHNSKIISTLDFDFKNLQIDLRSISRQIRLRKPNLWSDLESALKERLYRIIIEPKTTIAGNVIGPLKTFLC